MNTKKIREQILEENPLELAGHGKKILKMNRLSEVMEYLGDLLSKKIDLTIRRVSDLKDKEFEKERFDFIKLNVSATDSAITQIRKNERQKMIEKIEKIRDEVIALSSYYTTDKEFKKLEKLIEEEFDTLKKELSK